MKLKLLNRAHTLKENFVIKRSRYPKFLSIWHYHSELELVTILRGTGIRFVGDSAEKFEPGEVVLLGKNLPHMWLSDNQYLNRSSLTSESLAIYFKDEFLGKPLVRIPGMERVATMFQKAEQGIKFFNLPFSVTSEIEYLMQEKQQFEKLMRFIRLLYQLAQHHHFVLLSNLGCLNSSAQLENDQIHEYIFNNFNKTIRLSDVAEVAKMNPSSFSRFFKRINSKTFSRYLAEIRVGFACRLLVQKKYNIIYVCHQSGFNNLSNFNKQFKSILGMSPSAYLKLHR